MEHTCRWKIQTSFLVVLLSGVAGCQPASPASAAKPATATVAVSPPAAPASNPAEAAQPIQPVSPVPGPAVVAEKKSADAPAKSAGKPATEASDESSDEEKPRDLGPPLVDDLKDLRKLDPVSPVWIDMKHRQVVFQGEVCQANYPLEFLVTYPDRGYESVMVVKVRPSVVHAGLMLLKAEPGHPVRFQPKYEPATGTPIEIKVRWKDKKGRQQEALAQEWVREIKTKRSLKIDWVFGGSGLWKDETTGKQEYQADLGGDFISVLNLPSSTLDLPIKSEGAIENRSFEGYVERLPPAGTPVTLLLRPKLAGPIGPK
jgi:hypothetical protein